MMISKASEPEAELSPSTLLPTLDRLVTNWDFPSKPNICRIYSLAAFYFEDSPEYGQKARGGCKAMWVFDEEKTEHG